MCRGARVLRRSAEQFLEKRSWHCSSIALPAASFPPAGVATGRGLVTSPTERTGYARTVLEAQNLARRPASVRPVSHLLSLSTQPMALRVTQQPHPSRPGSTGSSSKGDPGHARPPAPACSISSAPQSGTRGSGSATRLLKRRGSGTLPQYRSSIRTGRAAQHQGRALQPVKQAPARIPRTTIAGARAAAAAVGSGARA